MQGKRIVFERKGQAALTDMDVPQPAAGEIVIENDYTVISAGTERANLVQLPNTVVEVTGSAAALQQALEYIAWEGRISLLGCTRTSDAPIDYYKYVHQCGVSLIGAHTFTRAQCESAPGRWTEREDYRTFLKLLGAGKLTTRPFISEIVSPQAGPVVFARLSEAENVPLGIVFDRRQAR